MQWRGHVRPVRCLMSPWLNWFTSCPRDNPYHQISILAKDPCFQYQHLATYQRPCRLNMDILVADGVENKDAVAFGKSPQASSSRNHLLNVDGHDASMVSDAIDVMMRLASILTRWIPSTSYLQSLGSLSISWTPTCQASVECVWHECHRCAEEWHVSYEN